MASSTLLTRELDHGRTRASGQRGCSTLSIQHLATDQNTSALLSEGLRIPALKIDHSLLLEMSSVHLPFLHLGFALSTEACRAEYEAAKRTLVVSNGQNTGLLSIGLNLWEALEILCTTPHHWLWVDAVCINQDEFRGRSSQVNIMDRIFARSYCVFVWLGKDQSSLEDFE